MSPERLTPRGLVAFVSCAWHQHRAMHQGWRRAVYVAWHFGPVR